MTIFSGCFIFSSISQYVLKYFCSYKIVGVLCETDITKRWGEGKGGGGNTTGQ